MPSIKVMSIHPVPYAPALPQAGFNPSIKCFYYPFGSHPLGKHNKKGRNTWLKQKHLLPQNPKGEIHSAEPDSNSAPFKVTGNFTTGFNGIRVRILENWSLSQSLVLYKTCFITALKTSGAQFHLGTSQKYRMPGLPHHFEISSIIFS